MVRWYIPSVDALRSPVPDTGVSLTGRSAGYQIDVNLLFCPSLDQHAQPSVIEFRYVPDALKGAGSEIGEKCSRRVRIDLAKQDGIESCLL